MLLTVLNKMFDVRPKMDLPIPILHDIKQVVLHHRKRLLTVKNKAMHMKAMLAEAGYHYPWGGTFS